MAIPKCNLEYQANKLIESDEGAVEVQRTEDSRFQALSESKLTQEVSTKPIVCLLLRYSETVTGIAIFLSVVSLIQAIIVKSIHSNDDLLTQTSLTDKRLDQSEECQKIPDQIAQLIKRQETKKHKVEVELPPVSAHLPLAAPPRIPGSENKSDPYFNSNYNVCLNMSASYQMSSILHARGVHIVADGVVIQHSGYYFVYNSVNFKPNTTRSSSTFDYQTWYQYVYKLRPNSPALSSVLTKIVHTCCLNCTNSQSTAFLGGVFHLAAGDIIQVCLTGQGLVKFNERSSFLGLFMLNSDLK